MDLKEGSNEELEIFVLLSACQPADFYQGRVNLNGSHQPGKDEVVPGALVVVDGEAALDQGHGWIFCP